MVSRITTASSNFWQWYYKRVWLLRKHLWSKTANRIEGPLELLAVIAFAIQGFLRTPYASGIPQSYQNFLGGARSGGYRRCFFSSEEAFPGVRQTPRGSVPQ